MCIRDSQKAEPSISLTELLRSKTVDPPKKDYFHGFETVSYKELSQLEPTMRTSTTTTSSTTRTTTSSTTSSSAKPSHHEGLKGFNFLQYLERRRTQTSNGGVTFGNPYTTEPPEVPTAVSLFSSSPDYNSLPFPFVPGSHGHRHVGMMNNDEGGEPGNR